MRGSPLRRVSDADTNTMAADRNHDARVVSCSDIVMTLASSTVQHNACAQVQGARNTVQLQLLRAYQLHFS